MTAATTATATARVKRRVGLCHDSNGNGAGETPGYATLIFYLTMTLPLCEIDAVKWRVYECTSRSTCVS